MHLCDFNFQPGDYAWMVYGCNEKNEPLYLKVRIHSKKYYPDGDMYVIYGSRKEFEEADILVKNLTSSQDWAYGYADPDELSPCSSSSFLKLME